MDEIRWVRWVRWPIHLDGETMNLIVCSNACN
jgi:hypothetical protein